MYEEFASKVKTDDTNFLERGTNLRDNHSKKLHKELLNYDM